MIQTTASTASKDMTSGIAISDTKTSTRISKKKLLKDARNIGGWISPIFSLQLGWSLDRSILAGTNQASQAHIDRTAQGHSQRNRHVHN
jgi:hypothetical protein